LVLASASYQPVISHGSSFCCTSTVSGGVSVAVFGGLESHGDQIGDNVDGNIGLGVGYYFNGSNQHGSGTVWLNGSVVRVSPAGSGGAYVCGAANSSVCGTDTGTLYAVNSTISGVSYGLKVDTSPFYDLGGNTISSLTGINSAVTNANTFATFSVLPAASGQQNKCTWIADGAASPVYGANAAGGATTRTHVCSNGANWINN